MWNSQVRALLLASAVLALLVPEAALAEEIIVKREAGASAADVRADAGVRLVDRLRLPRTEVVKAPPGETTAALRALQGDPDVEYAVLDRPVHALSNDSLFPFMWDLHNTGQTGGTVDADIDAPEAWGEASGADVEVAVVDSGVKADHPDLGTIGAGVDWVDGDGDPNDEDGHGTHVTGTIAAVRDNGLGVAGVAPDATVIPLRVLDENGEGDGYAVADALAWAGDHDIRVVNASFGAKGFWQPEHDAIDTHRDTLYVIAAGNGGSDSIGDDNDGSNPEYPCSYDLPNIICVGASDANDRRPTFSNFGAATVDLFAPGVDIWSTVPSGYQRVPGTSMAAPHVTGIAALLLDLNPNLTTAQLKDAILGTVDPSPVLCGLSVTGGRANAFAALNLVLNGVRPTPDCDDDGVRDSVDACPEQAGDGPNGCPASTNPPPPPTPTPTPNPTPIPPADGDGDGRSDASDRCPTERAATADGCPIPAFASLSKKVSSCRKGRDCTRSVRLTVRTDRAATVRVTVERKRCSRGRCTWRRVTRKTAPAPNRTARVTVKPLRPGAHRAVVTLTSSAGASKPRTLSFRVK
jgi:thermitase